MYLTVTKRKLILCGSGSCAFIRSAAVALAGSANVKFNKPLSEKHIII